MRSQLVAESRFGAPSRCHASVRPMRSRRGRVYSVTRALGFDFGEAPEPERKSRKKMSNLNTVAASLLVTAPIMRGAVAEAFLACLAATQKLQASNKDVLASYSKFYGLLLSAGYDSWQDYLLDQLLMGRDNPVARAVAQGGLEDGAPVLRALAHDLDMLQVLAVGLPEMAEYIGEMAPFASPDWVTAGSAAAMKRPTKQLRGSQPARVSALNINTPSKFITRPPTADELTQWKDLIASKEEWSQALPAVKQYWHLHGFGITSRNTTLRWVKGALEEAPDSGSSTSTSPSASPTVASQYPNGPLTCLEEHSSNLAINTQRHCDGSPACLHVLVAGPSGSGKSWLLWENTLAAGRERGVRLVDLNGADGATIVEAARGCGRYPRLRFILVADHVELPFRGAGAAEFMAGLSNVGPGGWPSNTLLYCGATANSTVHMDPIVGRFGVTLITKALTEDQFRTTIREMVQQRTGSAAPDDQVQHALEWAQGAGAYTIRSAAQYLSMN